MIPTGNEDDDSVSPLAASVDAPISVAVPTETPAETPVRKGRKKTPKQQKLLSIIAQVFITRGFKIFIFMLSFDVEFLCNVFRTIWRNSSKVLMKKTVSFFFFNYLQCVIY